MAVTAQHVSIGKRFGRRLRAIRRAHGFSQAKLASHLGIDRSFVSAMENGRKSPTLNMLETLALGFKMTLPELLRPLDKTLMIAPAGDQRLGLEATGPASKLRYAERLEHSAARPIPANAQEPSQASPSRLAS